MLTSVRLFPFVLLLAVAACVQAPRSKGVSVGASSGKTATETLAAMSPEAAAPMFSFLLRKEAPRNENGEIEVFMGAADKDSMTAIRGAGKVICQSINMNIVSTDELARDKDGVRKIRHRCK